MIVPHVLRRFHLDGCLYVANNLVSYCPSHAIRVFFYRYFLKFTIGEGTHIFMRAWFDSPGKLSIGTMTTVNQRCRLDSRGGLRIGSNVSISADVVILTASHMVKTSTWEGYTAPVDIGDYVFIGTRAMILPGVTLGVGAVVGAGAIVTKSVAAYQIVAGNPARPIGTRPRDLDYCASYKRLFQ